jgi:signal peptidase I
LAANRKKSKLREYAEAIVIAVMLALMIRAYVVQAFKIPSGSMIPTLVIGDHILVNKFIYGVDIPFTDGKSLIYRQPKREDVIVFSFPKNRDVEECRSIAKNIKTRFSNALSNGDPSYLFKDDCKDFIKRVVGVGGDIVEVKNKRVYVNDIMLLEPYKIHKDTHVENEDITNRDNFGPVTVPHGKFFVMGDNRDQSYDSRFWGFVDMNDIKGKAFIIYWSWDGSDLWYNKVRWGRIGNLIH